MKLTGVLSHGHHRFDQEACCGFSMLSLLVVHRLLDECMVDQALKLVLNQLQVPAEHIKLHSCL